MFWPHDKAHRFQWQTNKICSPPYGHKVRSCEMTVPLWTVPAMDQSSHQGITTFRINCTCNRHWRRVRNQCNSDTRM